MHQALVTTRPERTSDQIAADRKSATAFFDRLSKRSGRDLGRLAERESHYYKLLMCDKEGREWAGKNTVTAAVRRVRRAKAVANNLNRDDNQLCQYVTEETRKTMPLPQLHQQDRNQRRNSGVSSNAWRARVANPSSRLRGRAKRDATAHFEHWLLTHPQYGPDHTAVAPAPDRKPFNPAKTVPGQFWPAGTTPERALQIAIDALNRRGGKW